MGDARENTGKLVSLDPKATLAIIKIDSHTPLPPMKFGDPSELVLGETVIALGSAGRYENTVTRAIISQLHRAVQVTSRQAYEDLIQIDASFHPGNSGGPLLNMDGEMVGLNVAIRPGAQGIGFAIPVDQVLAVAKQAGLQAEDGGQKERVHRERPRGTCSIGGTVVSAATGEPVSHALLSLFYPATARAIQLEVAADGTFLFKDIPRGPFWLHTRRVAGYRDMSYNPDGLDSSVPKVTLDEDEQRSDVVLKLEPGCRISGKIRGARGAVPQHVKDLRVMACFEKDGRYQSRTGTVDQTDGSYVIDGLEDLPTYVMISGRNATREGSHFPPVFYPSTFSRSKATPIVFDENRAVEGVHITLQTEGGLTLVGTITDEDGDPVPEALVVVHRSDMHAGHMIAYADEQGQYRIHGLGDGEFQVHMDATHRGHAYLKTSVELDDAKTHTTWGITLPMGVLISGRFVDQEGRNWQIGRSYGLATCRDRLSAASRLRSRLLDNPVSDWVEGFLGWQISASHADAEASNQENPGWSFDHDELFERDGPASVAWRYGGQRGGYGFGAMFFPTNSTFAIPGLTAGQTELRFTPKVEGKELLEIRYQGKDILKSGLKTTPGEAIEDVVIVIGEKKKGS